MLKMLQITEKCTELLQYERGATKSISNILMPLYVSNNSLIFAFMYVHILSRIKQLCFLYKCFRYRKHIQIY
jgi:hypothetical protein